MFLFLLCTQDVDRWNFDVFALDSVSSGHALQTLFVELIVRYELNSRFKVHNTIYNVLWEILWFSNRHPITA